MSIKRLLSKEAFVCAACLPIAVLAYGWKAGEFTDGYIKLPYQLFEPAKAQASGPLQLVIYLHGSGEAGVDYKAQLYAGKKFGPDYFASSAIQGIQSA